jgi:hypothetical protein
LSDTNPTPYERARRIIDHPIDHSYRDGRRIIEILLADRGLDDLSFNELRAAFKGSNWCGEHALSFEAARRALVLDPTSMEAHHELDVAIRHLSFSFIVEDTDASHAVLSIYDRVIEDGIGAPAFWHVRKAVHFYDLATQDPECEDFIDWDEGDPIHRPEALEEACRELGLAIRSDPRLLDEKDRWMESGLGWDRYFLALRGHPEYRKLMRC